LSNIVSQFVDQIDDEKIQVTANGLNKSLNQALLDEDIGKPGGGLGLLYSQTFKSLQLASFSTGNDVNLSTGTIAGSFAEETVNPLSGTRSLKYTQASGSLNDFVLSEALPVSPKFRGRRLVASGNYTYKNGGDFDIQFVFYDVTNSTIKTVLSDTFKSSDGVKVARFYTTIPANCTEYKWGWIVRNETVGAELIFDDLELDTDVIKILSLPVEDDIGRIEAYGRNNVPAGWLYCDGSAVSRTTYAALYAEVGDAFGAGDGSTTFNLPDMRGEFLRGQDDGRGVDTGRALGSNQSDATAVNGLSASTTGTTDNDTHNHIQGQGAPDNPAYNLYGKTGTVTDRPGGSSSNGVRVFTDSDTHNHSLNASTSLSGDSETRPRNVAVRYYIKAESLQRLYTVTEEGRGTIGEVIAYVDDTAPDNFIYCDGSAVSRTDFADLFAVMGTKFGIGDGSTTFNLPDMRGQFIRGVDDGRGLDPEAGARSNGGDTIGSTQLDAMQRITGEAFCDFYGSSTNRVGNMPNSTFGAFGSSNAGRGAYEMTGATNGYGAAQTGITFDSANSVSPNPAKTSNSETRPTNVGMKFFVRYKKDPINVFAEVFDDYRVSEATSSYNIVSSDTWEGNLSLDLDPGVWEIGYEGFLYMANSSPSNTNMYGNLGIRDNTNGVMLGDTISLLAHLVESNFAHGSGLANKTRVEITQPTQYILMARGNNAGAANLSFSITADSFTGGLTTPDNSTKIWAKKVKDV
jgi:microcystin-dependent protein